MRHPRAARPADQDAPRRSPRILDPGFTRAASPQRFWFALEILLTLFYAACAAQSPPVPPRIEHPQASKDLTVEQIGQALRFYLTLPALATDGESLAKPLEVEIFQAVSGPGHKGAPAVFPPRPWISLTAQQVQKISSGRSFTDLVPLSTPTFRGLLDSTVQFSVVTLTRGFRRRAILSAPSNTAAITVLDVSGPLAPPAVETTEKALVVRWAAPSETLTGAPISNLSGYRIYSSTTGAAGPFELIGESRSTEYADPDFEFGRRYDFSVRAVFSAHGATATSQPSPPFEITPRDTFPPAVPQGLAAIETQAGVELVWQPDDAPDLAGYRVYRREGANPFQLLTSVLLQTPVYRDLSAAAGASYSYAVTAVDLSGNESDKSKQVTIRVR